MRTEYCFTVDGAELVYVRQAQGTQVITINHRDEYGKQQLCSMFVVENELARREFMNHFGDDSSWPPGWWDKLLRPQFTKLSWTQENYPPSEVSWPRFFERNRLDPNWRHKRPTWQEYFEVKSP